jgi:hypothetical protein
VGPLAHLVTSAQQATAIAAGQRPAGTSHGEIAPRPGWTRLCKGVEASSIHDRDRDRLSIENGGHAERQCLCHGLG